MDAEFNFFHGDSDEDLPFDPDDPSTYPEGVEEAFLVRGPEDLKKLPREALEALIGKLIMQQGEQSTVLLMVLSTITYHLMKLIGMAEITDNGDSPVTDLLRNDVRMIGDYLDKAGLVPRAVFDETNEVARRHARGEIDRDEAGKRMLEIAERSSRKRGPVREVGGERTESDLKPRKSEVESKARSAIKNLFGGR